MKKLLLIIFIQPFLLGKIMAQCNNATPQVVVASTTSSICVDGNSSYFVRMQSSEVGYEYSLKDTLTGNVITGPLDGNGGAIDFDTRFITRTTTFEIIAQPKASAGNALRFGGGTSDLALNTSGWNFDYSQGYTVEFVFNGNTNPLQFYNGLLSLGSLSISDLEVYFQQAANQLTIVHGRGQANTEFNQYASPTAFTDVHIAIVFDPSLANTQERLQVYYDGVAQTRTNTSSFITSMLKTQGSSLRLGNMDHIDFNNLLDVCNGIFDELRIWSDARSASEIDANKAGCVSTTEQGLVHYYQFDEGNGSTIADGTSSGYDLNIFANSGNMSWESELIACVSSSSCQVPMANTVTIGDLDAPTFNLLANATASLDVNGDYTLVPRDFMDNLSDNCTATANLAITADLTSFDCTNLGANTVNISVADAAGNKTSQDIILTIQDDLKPAFTPNNTASGTTLDPLAFSLDAASQVQITFDDLRTTVADNCDDTPSIILVPSSFGCVDLGEKTVTITATDASGNVATSTEIITIKDETNPVAAAQDITIALDADGAATIQTTDINTTSSDNCTAADNLVLALSKTTFGCADLGANTVELTVTDASGNEGKASAIVTVEDVIIPTVIAQNISMELDANDQVIITPADVDNGSSDNCSFTLSLDKTTFARADLGDNTVTLTATDPSGNSATATATVTVEESKSPQTITFALQDAATYGDAPIALSATASSGLAVSYTVTGAGELTSNNEVQINGAGDIVVTATQAGNAAFSTATEVVETISIAKANLAATAADLTITYGNNQLLSFSVNFTGFVGDDTALDIDQIPSAGSQATSVSDAGTYPITIAPGSDDDYDFTYVNGVFTIEKANQVITFPTLSDVDIASTTVVVFSATSDAGLPIQYSLIQGAGIANVIGNEVTLSGTGEIIIEATQVGTNNYNAATPVQQTFDATDTRKQDQGFSLSGITDVTYGDAPITLNATASSGLPVTFTYLSGPATLTGNVVTITGAGTVEIELTQDGNDSFNPANPFIQSFDVDAAMVTITPDDQQIIRGEALPVFTYTYSGLVNGDSETDFDQLPTVGSPTANASVSGDYPIVITQDAVDANYIFTNGSGTLTVSLPLNVGISTTINVYPNPAVEIISISGLSDHKANYTIIGLDGKTAQSGSIGAQLDVANLKTGVYLMLIRSDEGTTLLKQTFIKK